MIYYGIGTGMYTLNVGDEVILCTKGIDTLEYAVNAIGDIQVDKSMDACEIQSGLDDCNRPLYIKNDAVVYTATCGTNTSDSGYIGVNGYNTVKITAIVATDLSIAQKDISVGNCFQSASEGSCCPETNALLQSILTAMSSINIGDITVEVDDIEELLQTLITNEATCCATTNLALQDILTTIDAVDTNLDAVLLELQDILVELQTANTNLTTINTSVTTLDTNVNTNITEVITNQDEQTTLLTHIDGDLHDILLELQKSKDFEPIALLDCDGTLYYSYITYNQTDGTYTYNTVDTTGTAYTPTCANPVVAKDIEIITECVTVEVAFGAYNIGDILTKITVFDTSTNTVTSVMYVDYTGAIATPTAPTDVALCQPASIPQYAQRQVCDFDSTLGQRCLTQHTEYTDGAVTNVWYTDEAGAVTTFNGACTRQLLGSEALDLDDATAVIPTLPANTNHVEIQFFEADGITGLVPVNGVVRIGATSTLANTFETDINDYLNTLELYANIGTASAHIRYYFVPTCGANTSYNIK